MLDKLTVNDFTPVVGETFSLDAGDAGSHELTLVDARTIEPGAPPTDAAGRRSPFALDLRGPADQILQQATYRLQNDGVGALEIFIVPVGRTDAGTHYEAIFT